MTLRVKAKDIFSWLLSEFRERPLSLTIGEALEEYSENVCNIPEDLVDSKSAIATEVVSLIDDYVSACNVIGKTALIYRSPWSTDLILSGIRVSSRDSSEDQHRKKLLACLDGILASLYNLTPAHFEAFACQMLKRAGVPAEQTVLRGDNGVDFHGETEVPFSRAMADARYAWVLVTFIGQVKRYSPSRTVGPDKFRELVGTLVLEMQEAAVLSPYYGATRPYFTIFATTSRVSHRTWLNAKARGCIVLDGQMVVELMIDTYINSIEASKRKPSKDALLSWFGVS